MSIFNLIDDKHIPLYRVVWVADTPHFCGAEDCTREGYYEVRLEQGESVWANRNERDELITSIDGWQSGQDSDEWQE